MRMEFYEGRILICDDRWSRLDIKQILRQSDYEVAAKQVMDLKLLNFVKLFRSSDVDIKLPLLDGLSAGKKILDDELAYSVLILCL